MRLLAVIGAFIVGCLSVAVLVLTIHDQQTIGTLKKFHSRIKSLEGR